MKTWVQGDTTFIELSGPINEHAQFGEIRPAGKVQINLTEVTALNSVGTRSWCLWIQRFRAASQVVLEGCPPIMVKSFGTVKGFLPERCQVRSFVIPFYSDISGESRDFLAEAGKHFDAQGRLRLPEVKDSKGNLMEIDVIESAYLSFLRR